MSAYIRNDGRRGNVMPFKKDASNARKTAKKPARRKRRGTGSSAFSKAFNRYNDGKVSLEGLKMVFLYLSYRLGYGMERTAAKAGEGLSVFFGELYRVASAFGERFADFVEKLYAIFMDDLGEPIRVISDAFATIRSFRERNKASAKSGDKSKGSITGYITRGVKRNKHHAMTLISYAAPVVAAIFFFGIVQYTFSREYGMNVFINDENVGTIKNYSVLESADKMIEGQLVSTGEQTWELDATVRVTGIGNKQTLDARQLTNNILNASNEDIVSASGLYVNGEFRGAVENRDRLTRALDSLKAPYENGDPNRTVSFVEDVSVVNGIFFTDSIVPESELTELVHGEVSGEKRYTVVSGDSPSKIASTNGITTKTLYSLNPGLEGGGLWVGDELVVSASVPFLQVKYTERSVREVDIPYKTVTEKNNSMALGTTKISQQGEYGIREEVVDSLYIDGIYQGETIVQSTVTKEPVTKIIQSGTLWNGQVVTGGTGRIIWPVPGFTRLSRGFVGRYPRHDGLDIPAPWGTPIVAADSGVVTTALYTNRGYGIYCVINHGSYATLYGHCSALYVSVGQQVSKGQVIGRVGSTGNSTGPHCHFEVQVGKTRYNPFNWM